MYQCFTFFVLRANFIVIGSNQVHLETIRNSSSGKRWYSVWKLNLVDEDKFSRKIFDFAPWFNIILVIKLCSHSRFCTVLCNPGGGLLPKKLTLEPSVWLEHVRSCYGTYTVGVNIKREMVWSPNYEKVASSIKHTQFKTRVHKPKWSKLIPYFRPNNTLEKIDSDWQKRSAFLVNTVQKSVTQVQIQQRYPKLKRRLPEATDVFWRPPKIVRNLPKISEDRMKPSKDYRRPRETFRRFRRSPEHFRRSPEYFRRLPKHFWRLATISGNLQRSPDILEAFPSFRRSKAILSVYLSSNCMVRGFKLSIFSSVLLISNHRIFLVQFGINKHL